MSGSKTLLEETSSFVFQDLRNLRQGWGLSCCPATICPFHKSVGSSVMHLINNMDPRSSLKEELEPLLLQEQHLLWNLANFSSVLQKDYLRAFSSDRKQVPAASCRMHWRAPNKQEGSQRGGILLFFQAYDKMRNEKKSITSVTHHQVSTPSHVSVFGREIQCEVDN